MVVVKDLTELTLRELWREIKDKLDATVYLPKIICKSIDKPLDNALAVKTTISKFLYFKLTHYPA